MNSGGGGEELIEAISGLLVIPILLVLIICLLINQISIRNNVMHHIDFRNANLRDGVVTNRGFQVSGNLIIEVSSHTNLADAAQQIHELLHKLRTQGVTMEVAQEQVANDLAKQAKKDPTVMGKLVHWSQSLADTAGKTTVSEAAKGVVKLALQMAAGISLP